MRRPLLFLILILTMGSGSLLSGCASYNTFYNAKTYYSEAEGLGKEIDQREWPTAAQRPKYRAAIAKCEMLLEEYPDSGHVDDALFLMGKCQYRLREYRKAIRNFDNVLTNFPGGKFTEESLFLKSLSHLELGEEQISLDTLRRLRESYPKSKYAEEALYRIGDTFAAREDFDQALFYYEEFLTSYPKNRERGRVLYETGMIYKQQERYEDAARVLDEIAKDRRKENLEVVVEAKLLRAESLIEIGESEEAAKLLASVADEAALFNKRGRVLILEGRIQLFLGNESEGVSILEQAASEFPSLPTETESRYLIARYYLETRGPDEDEIVEQLQTAVDQGLKGDFAEPTQKLRLQMRRYDTLTGRLDEPDSNSWRDAFSVAELLYQDLEQPELALGYYRLILDDYPDSPIAPRAAYAIGFIEEESNDDSGVSASAYALLEERYPDSPQARARRGEVFLEARVRTAEELAAAGAPAQPGVVPGFEGPSSQLPPILGSGERASLDLGRPLRFGGPGASVPRGGFQR